MSFQSFVGDESSGENKEERPSDRKCGASEIENEEGAQNSSEKELHYVHVPKMRFGRVLFVGLSFTRAYFFIFFVID